MDQSVAHLMEYNDEVISKSIHSDFILQKKVDALDHSESCMDHKEQQQQEKFYKKIGIEILKYRNVLLFGPTNAKSELHNYLLKDHHFNDIKFDIKSANKMTTSEQMAFVKNHFTMH